MYNPRNVRAGNPDVALNSESPEPIVERASSKLGQGVEPFSYAATKPKARSTMGFLLSGRLTRQGASANGPAWAAPKRHRHSLPARFAAQPVREGLHKICLPRGDNTATYRQNRGVQRALGLFHPLWVFEIKEPEGEDSSPITLSRALPERK